MKKNFGLILLFVMIYGCTAAPTTSNPTVTQTLTLNSSVPSLYGTGTFYDISTGAATNFTIGGMPWPSPSSAAPTSFTTGKHDTIEFKVSLSTSGGATSPPFIFTYQIGTASSAVTTDAGGNYTSPEFTF